MPPVADPLRVLVVEDEEQIRAVLCEALSMEGHDVQSVADGAEALALLGHWSPDVVLLDLMMPIMDGRQFLAERTRQGLARDARVVIVSAARQTRVDDAEAHGVAAVVPKPFDLDLLLETVARAARSAA